MLTPDDLSALESRNRARRGRKGKAWPAPWAYEELRGNTGVYVAAPEAGHLATFHGSRKKSDARFAVAARNDDVEGDVDRLIAEVRRLRGDQP